MLPLCLPTQKRPSSGAGDLDPLFCCGDNKFEGTPKRDTGVALLLSGNSPEALPDYDQIILVYCRSGNRSKQASEKLAAMGYKNVYEFGGINSWTGEIVTD